MTRAEFIENYQATELALQAYVEGLPFWVNVWRGWMFFIFGSSVVFLLWKQEARWLAAVMVTSIFAYNLVAMVSGVGRFPSIAFVVLWSPLAACFAHRWRRLQPSSRFDRIYSHWCTAALATLGVSLAFDTYNVAYSLIEGVP